jgi:hypothetical protein
MTCPFECRQESKLAELEATLRQIRSSSRATLVAAILTPLGAVSVAVVAGWFGLQQTREQAGQRGAEAGRQAGLAETVQINQEVLRLEKEQARAEGRAEGRSEALAEALAASKREGVASASRKR